MKTFRPALISSLKGYNAKKLTNDVISGVIVAIIALPLSIALALASGVGPEQGLYTAIFAGFVIAALGGSTVQVSGPTAAFATIVAGIVATNGIGGLALATIMAGVILLLMGVLRLGRLIKFIPATITTGFTAGIAVTIVVGQLKDFLGLTYPAGLTAIETGEKLEAVLSHISTINGWAVAVGLAGLAVLIVWPRLKVVSRVPGSLVAVLLGIAAVSLFDLPVNTIGDLYDVSSALPAPRLPSFDLESVRRLLPDAFTIALLAAIESLLSCVVADGMVNTKHNPNTELIAQGVGNISSAVFGGIPATGAIARTAANVKSGGRTPISAIVHAVVLLLILVLLMPFAALIPMPIIAAILFHVAYNMCGWRTFVRLCRTAPLADVLVLVVTFLLTVIFDLVVAIAAGLVLACVLFMKSMSESTELAAWEKREEGADALPVPDGVAVFEVSGPLFFGAADRIAAVCADDSIRCMVLRMRGVHVIDATAMDALITFVDRCDKKGVRVILSHVNERPRRLLEKSGLAARLGEDAFAPDIREALSRAAKIANN